MFSTSTHRKHWMFENDVAIDTAVEDVHQAFVAKRSQADGHSELEFLTLDECQLFVSFHERKLVEFCNKFQPPMPPAVIGTAVQYYKRFYVKNSVMDYHPKEILVTAAYLACKVEEFNVSIDVFISNIKGNRERAKEVILHNEMVVMREMNFNLTVHNPYRAAIGLLMDLQVRCGPIQSPDADASSDDDTFILCMHSEVVKFLNECLLTRVSQIYAPSQIALAAVIHAAARLSVNVDSYVTDILFAESGASADREADATRMQEKHIKIIIDVVRKIRLAVKNVPQIASSQITPLQDKLELCRNQENNPDSEIYKKLRSDELNSDIVSKPKAKR